MTVPNRRAAFKNTFPAKAPYMTISLPCAYVMSIPKNFDHEWVYYFKIPEIYCVFSIILHYFTQNLCNFPQIKVKSH